MARRENDHAVTMRDVAEDAGVSVKTVSNVVNDYPFISQRTRDKVMASIKKLGYTVNVTARNLRTGHTGIIGLAVPDLVMPYFAQLSSLVIEEAKKLGMRVIVEPTLYSRQGELEALHGTQQAMLDGLIFSPLELGQDDVAELDVDYPLVLIGERIFTDKVDHVATENVEGAKRATKYLLQTGCRRLAVVGTHPGEKVGSAALRLQGDYTADIRLFGSILLRLLLFGLFFRCGGFARNGCFIRCLPGRRSGLFGSFVGICLDQTFDIGVCRLFGRILFSRL